MADELHVGVTGTRHALTVIQREALGVTLAWLAFGDEDVIVLHHGCCTGADEEAHRLARAGGGWTIHGHPGHGLDGKAPWRAGGIMGDLDVTHPSRRYHLRNRDIAEACSVLVAAPAYPEHDPRSARSGTWQCVREARSFDRDIKYAWPDGTTEAKEPA